MYKAFYVRRVKNQVYRAIPFLFRVKRNRVHYGPLETKGSHDLLILTSLVVT